MSVIVAILRIQPGSLSLVIRLHIHLLLLQAARSGRCSVILEAFDGASALVGWVLQGRFAASCYRFLIDLVELEEVGGERQQ